MTDAQDKNPVAVLDLMRFATVTPVDVREAPYTFELVAPTRTVHLAADSRQEMTEWISALRAIIVALSGGGGGGGGGGAVAPK